MINQLGPEEKALCGKFLHQSMRIEKAESNKDQKEKQTSRDELANLKDNQLQRIDSAPAIIQSKGNWNVSQIVKHEGGDHTFRNVLLFLVIAISIIFAVDLYKQMHQEKHALQLKRKKCYDQYMENQCQTPFDAIKERCHQLELCFHKDPEMTLRTSQIASKLLGKMVQAFLKETTLWGAVFLLLSFALFLCFILRHSRTTAMQETTLKKA